MNERKEAVLDNDRIEGVSHQVKGAVKRALGRMIGDAKLDTDGAAEKASGDAEIAAASTSERVVRIDTDRIKGVAHQLEGALKEASGCVTANPDLRQAGIAEHEAGRVQNPAGSARDSARDTSEEGK